MKSLDYSQKSVDIDEKNKWYLKIYAENLFNNYKFSESGNIYKKLIK